MSGIWDAVLTLDLTIPSNGPLVPGSSTVYIGGPNLPAELVALGANGAIIFYSSPTDTAAEYYYLAYFTNGVYFSISIGVKLVGDPILRQTVSTSSTPTASITQLTGGDSAGGFIAIGDGSIDISSANNADLDISANGTGENTISANTGLLKLFGNTGGITLQTVNSLLRLQSDHNDISIYADTTFRLDANTSFVRANDGMNIVGGNNAALNGMVTISSTGTVPLIRMRATNGVTFSNSAGNATESAAISGITTAPVIKAVSSASIDVWQSITIVQTLNGLANCSCKFAWRISIDRTVEVRVLVNAPGAGIPAAPTFFSMNCPTTAQGFPVIDSLALIANQGPHLVGIYATSAPAQGVVGCRIDGGAPAQLYTFNTPVNTQVLEVSGTFLVAK